MALRAGSDPGRGGWGTDPPARLRTTCLLSGSRKGRARGLGYTSGEAPDARGATRARRLQPWTPELSTYLMSVLAPAVGAVLAAVLESSVLTHLQVGSAKPDLVFAMGVAVAMVLGFESGVSWAFAGGVTLDLLLPGRALGSTALTLVLVTALALLVARATWPPHRFRAAAAAGRARCGAAGGT